MPDTRKAALELLRQRAKKLQNQIAEILAPIWAKTLRPMLKEYVLPIDRWRFADTFRALLPPDEVAALLAASPPKPDTTGAIENGDADQTKAAE
jgi:hypothetical protein